MAGETAFASYGGGARTSPRPASFGGLHDPLSAAPAALGAIQLDSDEPGPPSGAPVRELAGEAVAGASSPLPFGDRIQASFGGYDVSGIRAATGSRAEQATSALGARGLATGNKVALGEGADLHTAAHEAAHVVQQQAGVHLSSGVGAAGDRYERNADAVADRVVAGASAEPLLAQIAGPPRAAAAGGGAVQLDIMPASELDDAGSSGWNLFFTRKFRALKKSVEKYHAAKDATERGVALQSIVDGCDEWLAKNTDEKQKTDKRAAVVKLKEQAFNELSLKGIGGDKRQNVQDPVAKQVPVGPEKVMTTPKMAAVKEGLWDKGDPKIEDVKQGYLGDCFLLAAVGAVVKSNPDDIKKMMRDNGDSVTVRLFRDGKAQYVKVAKSIPKVTVQREEGATDVDPYAKGALWVQMIEKAYASLGGSYTSSEGGTGGGAFEALTGGASTIRRQGTDMKSVNARMAKTPWPDELPGQSFLVDDEEVEKAMAEKRILYQTVLGGKAGTWQSFVEKKVNHDKLRHLSSLEAVQEFLTQQRVDGSIVEAVMGYLESEHVFSGKLGSGKYDDRALEVFAGITQARASNKPVTAGTEKTLGTAEGRGDSGGEDKVKGLAGGHEYTVLATKEDGGLKWVQVRNPWGKYGAAYRKNEDDSLTREAIQEGDGVSWIELSDFMNDFNSVSST